MECLQDNICNCKKECNCKPGYSCCAQKSKSGDSTYGLCVKDGFCDKTRGLPTKGCKDGVSEGYNSGSCSDNKCMNALYVLAGVCVVLILLLGGMIMQRK